MHTHARRRTSMLKSIPCLALVTGLHAQTAPLRALRVLRAVRAGILGVGDEAEGRGRA